MKSFKYTITDPVGIHARPAGILVKEAQKYESSISISKFSGSADAKKLMALMSLNHGGSQRHRRRHCHRRDGIIF